VVLVVTASQRRHQAIEDVRIDTLLLAKLAAANQQQLISGARDILITLAQLPAVKNNDRQACLFFLSNVLMQHPLYANFGAADRQGDIFCMTLPQRAPINITDKSYFREAIRNLDFAVSEYQINPVNSQTSINLAYPILGDDGTPLGIVFAELDLRWLYQFESAAALPAGAQLRVIDQRGTTLALYPSGEEEIGKPMPEADVTGSIIQKGEGLIESEDVDGIHRMYAFTPLQASGATEVYMIVGIPTEAILADSTRDLALNLSALAGGALLALVVAWFGSNWLILRQVNDLVRVTRQLSGGDLSIRADASPDRGELGELALAFNEMAGALQQREAEQQRSQQQIRKQTLRAEALARIASRLNAHLELETVLEAVCEEVSQVLNVPTVSVLLLDGDTGDLRHFYTTSESPAQVKQRLEQLPTQILDEQASLGEPVSYWLEKPAGIPDALLDDLRQLEIQHLIAAAMVHEGRLIGYIHLYTFRSDEIGEDELTLLKGIADEAALAITNARLYQALQNEERSRSSLLSSLITAQEDERMRIARELHDETSQSLTALLVGFDVLRMALQSHPDRIEGHLQDQKAIVEELLDNIHRLITDLRPSLLDDLGLVPAIVWYGDLRLSVLGIEFDFNSDNLPERLPRSMETALFRIVQEAITNVVRHSNASIVTMHMTQADGRVILEISDNGRGFDPAILQHPDSQRGLGLRSMLERATILGGSFELNTAPEAGTHITISLPLIHFEVLHA
jgi:signal transduction histidine kinase/HAMP domain-containing protein